MDYSSYTIPPDEARRQREIAELLRPDHACTGSGGISQGSDGSVTVYNGPCTGCEAQYKRVAEKYPDLFRSPRPKRAEWFPKVNTLEYRNAVMPHLRHLLDLYEKNGRTLMDDEVRYFLDQVLIVTQDAVEA